MNNVPQWALRLRVEGSGPPYEAMLKLLTYTPPGNGATFPVRIDPLRRQHVVLADDDAAPATANTSGQGQVDVTSVDSRQMAEPGAAETIRLLADLDRMRDSGAIGDAEFDALKRKLLGEV